MPERLLLRPGVQTWPFYLAGEPQMPNADLEVEDKYTGKVAYRVAQATADDIDKCAHYFSIRK